MENEPEKPQKKTSTPALTIDRARKERRRIWRIIYIAGCFFFPIFFILSALVTSPYGGEETLGSVIFIPLVIIMLPIGLAIDFSNLVDHIFLNIDTQSVFWRGVQGVLGLLMIPLSYFIFWAHFRLTSEAKTQRTFLLLMVSLILLICASLIGCVREVSQPIGLQ